MFLSMIKEQIKEEVLREVRKETEFQQKLFYYDIRQILKLEKMSDKEIAKEYKHEKFKDVSEPIRNYLCRRYDIKILKDCHFYSICIERFSIYESNYISDFIENNILKQNAEKCCESTSCVIPAKKKATKRKK